MSIFHSFKERQELKVDTVFDEDVEDHCQQFQEEWYVEASKFLKEAAIDDRKKKDVRKKRVSPWAWECCLENLMSVTTSHGFSKFVDEGYQARSLQEFAWPPAAHPGSKPWLGLFTDQCSGNLTPWCRLVYEVGVIGSMLLGPNRRLNNDLWNAADEAGFGGWCREVEGLVIQCVHGAVRQRRALANHFGRSSCSCGQEHQVRSTVSVALSKDCAWRG